jgi:hypothetical protein
MRSRHVVPVLLAAVLLAGCSSDADAPPADALGTSELAPDPEGKAAREERKADRKSRKADAKADRKPGPRKARKTRPVAADPSTSAPKPTGTATRKPADRPPGVATASVPDASGDVRGSLTSAPGYVDITGARLTRDDGFEVRVTFAGTVPARQTDDRVVQVATFYDLDGDGETDYEAWASLADNGWGTSYRTPSGARFGDDSGVRARPDGRNLVITFPLGHLEGARSMSWAVGAEWGTIEQIASGTTAQDNAPDGGWARFPG